LKPTLLTVRVHALNSIYCKKQHGEENSGHSLVHRHASKTNWCWLPTRLEYRACQNRRRGGEERKKEIETETENSYKRFRRRPLHFSYNQRRTTRFLPFLHLFFCFHKT
jgi:hypothetical protein